MFRELSDWHAYFSSKLPLARDGKFVLRSIGINDNMNLIVIGVGDVSSQRVLEETLAPLGIPCGLLVTELWGPIVPLGGAAVINDRCVRLLGHEEADCKRIKPQIFIDLRR